MDIRAVSELLYDTAIEIVNDVVRSRGTEFRGLVGSSTVSDIRALLYGCLFDDIGDIVACVLDECGVECSDLAEDMSYVASDDFLESFYAAICCWSTDSLKNKKKVDDMLSGVYEEPDAYGVIDVEDSGYDEEDFL